VAKQILPADLLDLIDLPPEVIEGEVLSHGHLSTIASFAERQSSAAAAAL
jgi:hypothetical protein